MNSDILLPLSAVSSRLTAIKGCVTQIEQKLQLGKAINVSILIQFNSDPSPYPSKNDLKDSDSEYNAVIP